MTKKNVVDIRSAYTARERKGFETTGDSLTQQHKKDETDIRKIIEKYDRTGLIGHVQRGIAKYGDFSEINEYREALDIIANANATFAELPAAVREKFANDAGAFLEFATNPENLEEMQEMGLAPKPEPKVSDVPSPSEDPAGDTPAPSDS
jgi:phage internal scaffolding protein